MGSILSVPAAPQTASKATQTEWNCPVCHSVQSNADAVPCGHRFCLGCLLRRTAASPACPLCASPLLSARFSVLGHNDFLRCILSAPGAPLGPAGGARRALFRLVCTRPGPAAPRGAPSPAEPACAGPEPAEGLPPDMWAELLLDPVRPWLRQSLDAIYGSQWGKVRQVESIALATLCLCGLDRAALTHMLQSFLGEYTASLIHCLMHVTLHRCGDAWALPRRGRRAPPAAAAPAEPAQPQAEPEKAAPAPGPSCQGRSRRPWPIRRSQRRSAYKYRRPLRFRRRRPRRK